MTWVTSHLGDVARHHGHLEEAQRLYQQAIDAFSRLGDLWGTARSCADLVTPCPIRATIARRMLCSRGR